jgi:hypothetical protein
MHCPTPKLDIPPSSYESTRAARDATRLTRDASGDATGDAALTEDTLDIYIGFRLDGVRSYSNLSDTKVNIFRHLKYYVCNYVTL